MVLLDPTLPGEIEWEQEWLPEEYWLPAAVWESTAEKIDPFTSYEAAKAVTDALPSVPAILVATEDLGFPSDFPPDSVEAMRAMQEEMVAGFSPGEVVFVDTPHYMEPVIPEQIADFVRQVAQGQVGATSR